MARMMDMQTADNSGAAQGGATGSVFFRLGLQYSTGRDVGADLVSAHKWFNIAAAKGHGEAVRYRREVALEMNGEEIAEAQRAAREWLRLN